MMDYRRYSSMTISTLLNFSTENEGTNENPIILVVLKISKYRQCKYIEREKFTKRNN